MKVVYGELSASVRNARLAATRAYDLRAGRGTVAGATDSAVGWVGARVITA